MSSHNNRRRILLTPNAHHVVSARTTENVGRSILTNAILLRYESIVSSSRSTIDTKFKHREKEELVCVYHRFIEENPKALWFLDEISHKVEFCRIFREAISEDTLEILTNSDAKKVLEILEKHLNTVEFITLCDWLCKQSQDLSRRSHA